MIYTPEQFLSLLEDDEIAFRMQMMSGGLLNDLILAITEGDSYDDYIAAIIEIDNKSGENIEDCVWFNNDVIVGIVYEHDYRRDEPAVEIAFSVMCYDNVFFNEEWHELRDLSKGKRFVLNEGLNVVLE